MKDVAQTKEKRAKLNITVSLLCQLVTLLCGIIVPKLLIDTYGSEAYGATTSITQFLSYIALLEGGIGGVARAALYKPLAERNTRDISVIIGEIKRFFSVIAGVFAIYVIVLSCSYAKISGIQSFDWLDTFFLVWVISISTFAQYFIGISYSVLLQAAQKTYVINFFSLITVALNAILVVILVNFDCNLIIVKLVSGLVFALKPVAMWIYVKRKYNLIASKERNREVFKQKWTGLGQHIAFFLHSNTDIVILTILADLTSVAIYSVYYMIISHIQALTTSFSAGMEAFFGDLLAKKEYNRLNKWFDYYETLLSFVTLILFSVTAVLIVPFVRIYTSDVQDADYIQPLFSVILLLASVIYCLRLPYHSMVIAAGHFKQTALAAYGEAGINILLSLLLVGKFGLSGVALATLIATTFRLIYYVFYLSGHICYRRIRLFVKRIVVNIGIFSVTVIAELLILKFMPIGNYLQWAVSGGICVAVAFAVTFLSNWIFYRENISTVCRSFLSKFFKGKSSL